MVKKKEKDKKAAEDKKKAELKNRLKMKMIPGMKKSKAKKKKWSKSKVKEKLNNAAFYDKPLYDRLLNEIPKLKLITTSTVTDKLKLKASLARQGIGELMRLKKIKLVGDEHAGMNIYTRNVSK